MLALYSLKKNTTFLGILQTKILSSAFLDALKVNRYTESLMIDQSALFAECHDRPC